MKLNWTNWAVMNRRSNIVLEEHLSTSKPAMAARATTAVKEAQMNSSEGHGEHWKPNTDSGSRIL